MKFLTKIFAWVARLFTAVFGRISWTRPPWVTPALAKIGRNKRKILVSGIIVLALALLSAAGYHWYKTHQPVKLAVTGTSPGPTKLEKDAKPEPVHIYFSGSAARLEQVGKVVKKGITINPRIRGEWRWEDDSRLIFTPAEDWAVGQEYVVRFERSLFPGHVHLESYKYVFSSAPFEAKLVSSEFYQDPINPKLKKVVVTVKFSHPVDTEDFRKRVSLMMPEEGMLGQAKRSYPFTVSYDEFRGEAYIHSDPVTIPLKETYMELEIDKGMRSSRGGPPTQSGLESKVLIPSVYTFFRISSAELTLVRNDKYEPEQVLVIENTAGVLEKDMLKNVSVYVLPKDRPAIPGRPAERNYQWESPADVGPEDLKLSTPVKLTLIPTEREYSNIHSFRIDVEVGKYLYVKVNKGITSFGDYVLANEFDAVVRVPEYPKELNIMHDGAILSLSGEKKLSVLSRGIDTVRFTVARVLPRQINHLVSQSGGSFKDPDFGYNFNEDNITERFTEVRSMKLLPPGKTQYTAFDFSEYLKPLGASGSKQGLFFFEVEGWDPIRKVPIGISDKRLILITDLGLLIKDNADGSHDAFVMSIGRGLPVPGVRVEVLGVNGLEIISGLTDASGHVSFPTLKDFTREKRPTVYVAKKGDDLSFIPYNREDRQLNLSRFDVGGVYTKGKEESLNAYLFSDRGIYRPGDEFKVGMIVKSSNWVRDITGVPLEAVVTDARGLVVMTKKIKLGSYGFEELAYKTEETSPTGEYQVNLYIVKDGHRAGLLGSTTVRVEEFLPDRMKIATHFSKERAEGWVSPEGLLAHVTLTNLYGTPASNRRVTGKVTLRPAYTFFGAYKDFMFYDPLHTDKSFEDNLEDGHTNQNGECEFKLGLERFEKATYRLVFQAEGFEAEGGRAVSSESSVLVSPLPYLVGYKPDGKLRYINKGSARTVRLIAVDPALKKLAVSGLKVNLVEERYVSVLKKQKSGLFKYQSELKETTLKTSSLSIPAEGYKLLLDTSRPGDFAIVITDAAGTELNKIPFSVAGEKNLTKNMEKNAELQVRLDKTDYKPGEEIELQVTAPYVGAGIITIERDRVYSYKWFSTKTTSSVQRIKIPANLEGNGYVNVSFVRAMDSDEVFMSPLSYGVAPFSVSLAEHTEKITLRTPDLAKPGEPFRIRYKGQKKGKAVIFAVDEGILQVARYRTPDPISYFFQKRALEVNTSQILDLILPEYSVVKELSEPGGDYYKEALGKNINPFKRKREKPVVYWSGIVDLGTSEREVMFNMPDSFSGTIRVMAVAVAPGAVGAAEKKSQVRGYFVISPNVPTFVAPGDEFDVSVNVANNVEGSGPAASVKVGLKTSEQLEVLDGGERTLEIGRGREKSTSFKVRARAKLGSGNFTFTASLGSKKSRYSVDLSVRPPVPYMTTTAGGFIKSGSADVTVTRRMYPDLRTLEVSGSPLPLGVARGLARYLDSYPYLCTEQLVSRAMPALVLRNKPDFGYGGRRTEAVLSDTMKVLMARQNADGAFGFWTASSQVSDFQSVYAMHFLTEAKEGMYPVPQDLIDRGLAYLNTLASKEDDTLTTARVRSYAIYVLTRNGRVTTSYAAALQKHLEETFPKEWKKDLAGIYLAATYKMLKLDKNAYDIIHGVKFGEVQVHDYDDYYDGLTRDAGLLYVISRHFPERTRKLSGDDILNIVNPVVRCMYNTTSSAYTILALEAYADAVGNPKPAEFIVTEVLAGGKSRTLALSKGLFPKAAFSEQEEKLHIKSKGENNLFYQVTEAGFDLSAPKAEIKNKLEIQREYRNDKGEVVTSTTLGSELTVSLKARALGSGSMKNIALVDLLPGGFEVVMDPSLRIREKAVSRGSEEAAEDSDEESAGGSENAPARVSGKASAGSNAGPGKSTWTPDYVDVREDRVIVFGSADKTVREFVYRIKATNKGSYTVPPAYGEAMYAPDVKARSLGGKMTVTGNK